MNRPTEKQIEAACAVYWGDHWNVFNATKVSIRETMSKALSAALAVEAGTVGYAAIHAHTVRQAAARADEEGNEHIAERLRDAMRFIENFSLTVPTPTMLGTVGVKPLEWQEARVSDRWERYSAESPFGRYEALEWSNGGFGGTFAPLPNADSGVEFRAATLEAAKAAAQADYEARIRSALTPASSAVEGEAVAWMDDGTLRAGSSATAHRVITAEQKASMPGAVSSSFTVPLYTHPAPTPAGEGETAPDGWALVPIEPTQEMLDEACSSDPHPIIKYTEPHERDGSVPLIPIATWRAMMAARPASPAPHQEGRADG